jgi:ACR3 family arsenite efflux pump ArsB
VLAAEYVAGVIILAAAPCTAMVFVWSYLSDGDPAYTLVQVSVNDLIMLFLFAPVVKLLASGASGLEVPFAVLLYSVAVFVVIPLALGSLSRALLIRRKGAQWFETRFLAVFQPVTIVARLFIPESVTPSLAPAGTGSCLPRRSAAGEGVLVFHQPLLSLWAGAFAGVLLQVDV